MEEDVINNDYYSILSFVLPKIFEMTVQKDLVSTYCNRLSTTYFYKVINGMTNSQKYLKFDIGKMLMTVSKR